MPYIKLYLILVVNTDIKTKTTDYEKAPDHLFFFVPAIGIKFN
jgi:hypothetical protein